MPRFAWTSLGASMAAASLLLAPLGVHAQATPPAGTHVVQDGETLSQIALDANTDVATIVSLNGLADANALSVGQSLKLPTAVSGSPSSTAAAAPSAPAAASASAGTSAAKPGTYTVADGDTLWDIAQRFGTSTDALTQLNHLDDGSHLSPGMVLSLPAGTAGASGGSGSSAAAASASVPAAAATTAPAPSAPASTASKRSVLISYTVQPGETLGKIARQFSVSADAIVQASSLDDANKIGAGAVLKVPLPAREHTVAPGETLRDIAAGEKVDLGSLIDFNQLDDPELIRVGQVLVLPLAATQQAAAVAPSPSTPSASDAAQAPTAAATATPKPTAQAAAPAAPAGASTPGTQPSAAPAGGSTPSPKPTATPTPARPLKVATPPPGAPSDGLAGAGLKFLGAAYVWGGSSPSGFDCSGFVWYIARQVGKPLSRGLFAQYAAGAHPGRDQLQVGDLVFFQNTFNPGLSHNGIYIGNGQFVHAADESAGVTISSLTTAYWSSHWFGATRLP